MTPSSSQVARTLSATPTFAWDTTFYASIQAYRDALLPFVVPAWIANAARPGITLHHTYKPTAADWRGKKTMDGLERFYRLKGWPAGPHLFLAPDGLWAGTPLASRGVHAGSCNDGKIGIEIVGDFDPAPWDVGLRERVYQLAVLLLQWMRQDETTVSGHRECLANKSCPGWAVNMSGVRADIRGRLFDQHFICATAAGARVRSKPATVGTQILEVLPNGRHVPAHPVWGAAVSGDRQWVRVRLDDGRLGYVWQGLGRMEPV